MGNWRWRHPTAPTSDSTVRKLAALRSCCTRARASAAAGFVALAAAFVPRRSFDVFALSAVALGLNTLAVAGLGRLLFENAHGDPIGRLFLLGALAAGMLAASVNGVLRLARAHAAAEGATA